MNWWLCFLVLWASYALAGPSAQEISTWEVKLAQMINQERIHYGYPALKHTEKLSQIAKEHSQNMASGRVSFGHGGFQQRAEAIMRGKSHDSFGENVAYSYLVEDPLKIALEGWMKSKGHRDNILGDFNETGIGISFSKEGYCYLTQVFARRFLK